MEALHQMRSRLCGCVEDKFISDGAGKGAKMDYDWLLTRLASQGQGKGRILDVGCGGGFFLSQLSKEFAKTEPYGIDINKKELSFAKRGSATIFILASATNLPFQSGSLDTIVCLNLLHHLTKNNRPLSKKKCIETLSEMNRVLKQKGYFLMIEQCVNSRLMSHLIFIYTSLLSILSRQPWTVSFLTPEEIYGLFAGAIVEKREKRYRSKIYFSIKVARIYIVSACVVR